MKKYNIPPHKKDNLDHIKGQSRSYMETKYFPKSEIWPDGIKK